MMKAQACCLSLVAGTELLLLHSRSNVKIKMFNRQNRNGRAKIAKNSIFPMIVLFPTHFMSARGLTK